MAWMPSYTELRLHPKTQKLTLALGIGRAEAVGLLHLLWAYAMDYAKDGDLSEYTPAEIAAAAEWGGDPEAFVNALVTARFVDNTDSGLRLHNWEMYGGKFLQSRRKNADRMRETRLDTHEPAPVRKACATPAPHVSNTCAAREEERKVQDSTTPPHVSPPEPAPQPDKPDVAAIFEAYRKAVQPHARFLPEARAKIQQRLKTFSPEDLQDAIAHFAADAWQMSHNAHRGASWFFKSDQRIEEYLNLKRVPRKDDHNGHHQLKPGGSPEPRAFAAFERTAE